MAHTVELDTELIGQINAMSALLNTTDVFKNGFRRRLLRFTITLEALALADVINKNVKHARKHFLVEGVTEELLAEVLELYRKSAPQYARLGELCAAKGMSFLLINAHARSLRAMEELMEDLIDNLLAMEAERLNEPRVTLEQVMADMNT
jgi:hypothetical protein